MPESQQPYPRNIRTVDFGGYEIRLNQDLTLKEIEIRFNDGLLEERPSDRVLEIIRGQLVPDDLLTVRERAAGKPVPWFIYKGDMFAGKTGKGSWRMWIRNCPHAAHSKAEQVFNAVVKQVALDLGAGKCR